jgi:DNA-binding NtrC family response regulator
VASAYTPPCAEDAAGLRSLSGLSPQPALATPLLLPPSAASTTGYLLCSPRHGSRLLSSPIRIGRDPDNDWVLADSHASRRHVSLQPVGEGVRIRDLGSRNGTFINGVRIVEGLLRLGGRLTVGQTEFRLASADQGAAQDELLGNSLAMQRVRQQVQRFASSEVPVLILGESGTGKELVARALHRLSGRPGPLVAVNCGALPRELIESELFGHERGAFTGAQKRHLGCFGEAHGGTLFLDEIGELPLELQPRLLRALENRCIRPVGATREVEVDVRIVAATHRDLEQAVRDGSFRADLYYRLCGFEIPVPPLRERKEDIPLLLRHFLQQAERQGLPSVKPPSESDMAALLRDPWLGNVRELRAAVLRAVHLCGPQLTASDLVPAGRRRLRHRPLPPPASLPASVPSAAVNSLASQPVFAEVERQTFLRALSQAGGSCRRAAELLDLPKSTLHDKLRRLGIQTSRVKVPDSDGPLTSALPAPGA